MPQKPIHLSELEAAQTAIDAECFTEAIALLEPLCAQNHAIAKSMLGVLYQVGAGVSANGALAISLLTSAAEQGIGLAAHNLGTIYITGLPGVAPDSNLAKHYYRLARDLGCQLAPNAFYD